MSRGFAAKVRDAVEAELAASGSDLEIRDAVAFELEVQDGGKRPIPRETIDELVALRERAKDEAANFAEAIKIQAEKYQINKGALRRYVSALVDDKTSELDAEAEDIARLLLANEPRDGGQDHDTDD